MPWMGGFIVPVGNTLPIACATIQWGAATHGRLRLIASQSALKFAQRSADVVASTRSRSGEPANVIARIAPQSVGSDSDRLRSGLDHFDAQALRRRATIHTRHTESVFAS
jgi:hypothetical protein